MVWQHRLTLPAFLSVVVGCALALAPQQATAQGTDPLPTYVIDAFGAPPPVPDGPLSPELDDAIERALIDTLRQPSWDQEAATAMAQILAADDPRIAWLLSDLMRFSWSEERDNIMAGAASELLEFEFESFRRWGELTDHLIAWDIPAYPGYLEHKRAVFTNFVPGWERIFIEGDIDWRHVSWGGVLIDNRPFAQTDEICNCIPAADNPEVVSAAEATWLDEDDIIFGIEVNGAYRAYPRQIMEVREMVNDTLGGRDLGIPYCTLCGAAQAYFTDQLPAGVERPVLRTSGLLIRSNKVMYDLNTYSVFDTFRGNAVTGPLAEIGLQLEQATVITTDWASWQAAHPETTVLVEALALGRDFDFRNGRDANGPIFPVGDVDPRLEVHDDVIGVITASGQPVAFERRAALLALRAGAQITYENVRLELDAGGIRAVALDGSDLGSHEAFWFAWSQFHPGTELWTG